MIPTSAQGMMFFNDMTVLQTFPLQPPFLQLTQLNQVDPTVICSNLVHYNGTGVLCSAYPTSTTPRRRHQKSALINSGELWLGVLKCNSHAFFLTFGTKRKLLNTLFFITAVYSKIIATWHRTPLPLTIGVLERKPLSWLRCQSLMDH